MCSNLSMGQEREKDRKRRSGAGKLCGAVRVQYTTFLASRCQKAGEVIGGGTVVPHGGLWCRKVLTTSPEVIEVVGVFRHGTTAPCSCRRGRKCSGVVQPCPDVGKHATTVP